MKSFLSNLSNIKLNKKGLLNTPKEESIVSKIWGKFKAHAPGAAKNIVMAPSRIAEGEGKGILGFLFPQWFRTIFKFLVKTAVGLAIITLIIFSIIFVINYYQTGQGSTLVAKGETAVESSKVGVLAKLSAATGLDLIFNPGAASQYGFESEIEQSQTDPDLGVKITELKQFGVPYYGEPIEVTGKVHAKVPEETKIAFFCEIEQKDLIEPYLFPAEVSSAISSGNEATLLKNQLLYLQTICKFDKGLRAAKTTSITTTGTAAKIPLKSAGKLRLYAQFNYMTKASHNTYFLPSARYEELVRANQKPFEFYNINDPQIKSDGTAMSTATAGPVNLGIGTFASQPFVEKRPYTFVTTISNNLDWAGKLKKIEYLKIKLPDFLYLEGEPNYPGEKSLSSSCAFDYTGFKDEEGFKVYELKRSLMAETNQECDKDTLSQLRLSSEECIDLFGKNREINYRCNFIADALPQQDIQYEFIRAELKYLYQTERVITIEANKKPEVVSGVDTSLTEVPVS